MSLMDRARRSSKELIRVSDLKVAFQVGKQPLEAVRGIHFSLYEGEILGVVGESGSGKTVSMLSLLGLNRDASIVSGEIWIEGELFSSQKDEKWRKRRSHFFGMIFQEPSSSFDPIYTIEKCFLETFRTVDPSISAKEARKKSLALLEEVHIIEPESRLKNYPHQFSGGMLQRIMIALALANNPKVLVADEPTTALDVTIQAEIIQLLLELKSERGLSIIFISHNLLLVQAISDRLLVLYGGQILESGSAKEVMQNPYSPYTKALIQSIPVGHVHHSEKRLMPIQGSVCNPLNFPVGCPFAPRCDYKKKECMLAFAPVFSYGRREVRCFYPVGGMKGGGLDE